MIMKPFPLKSIFEDANLKNLKSAGLLLEAGSRVPAPIYFEQSTRLLKVQN